ncbi:MAG: T9SS type A sorting domain-containing protein [Bacteroidetes bacterium]|nr:T9SS type A sorting domain-containing protein [Bacteroidota bacterium]
MRLIFLTLLLSCIEVNAQITLSYTDFGTAGDTVRISQTQAGNLDFTSTGANFTWDFSSLVASSQYLKEFRPVGFSSILVFGTYGPLASSNYQASYFNPTNDLPLDQLSQFLPVELSNLNLYSKRTQDSITSLGYSIAVNGQGVPFKSDTIETRYKLPLNYNDSHYSRGYTYIDLNPIIDFKIKQYRERTSNVDGWGTIITPKGTFPVLRIRHDINERDSVYQTFFGGGQWFGGPLIQRIEYEWFTNGEKEWILKASENNGNVNLVEYQEDYLGLDASLSEHRFEVVVGPNPTSGELIIESNTPVDAAEVVDALGRIVLSEYAVNAFSMTLDLKHLCQGTYRVVIRGDQAAEEFSIVKW